MAVLVIAGSGRGAGKTAVGCALMAAIPERRWFAVKVTSHGHGLDEALWEEIDSSSEKDTGRYLAAGARRAFLISGSLDVGAAGLVAEARRRAAGCDALLVESNRVAAGDLAFLGEQSVTLAVLAGQSGEWKASLAECLGRVDALVLTGGLRRDLLPADLQRRDCFELADGEWISPEMAEFVRGRLLKVFAVDEEAGLVG